MGYRYELGLLVWIHMHDISKLKIYTKQYMDTIINVKTSKKLWNCPIFKVFQVFQVFKIFQFGLLEIVKFCQNWDIWSKLWNLVEIVKFGWSCKIWLWNLAKIGSTPISFAMFRFGLEGWKALNPEQPICQNLP